MNKIEVEYRGYIIIYDEFDEEWTLKVNDESLTSKSLSGLRNYIDNKIDGNDEIEFPTFVFNSDDVPYRGVIKIKRSHDYSGIIEIKDVRNDDEGIHHSRTFREYLSRLYPIDVENLLIMEEIYKNSKEIIKLKRINFELKDKLTNFEHLKNGHQNKYNK